MQALKRALTLTMLTAIPVSGFSCTPETWSGVTSDQWNVSTNWSPNCIPGSADDEATFGSTVGFGPIIFLDLPAPIDPALSSLTFNNSTTSFTISTTTSQFLTFLNVPDNFLIVDSGSHTINARVEIFSSTTANTLNVEVNSGSQLTIGRAITNTFGPNGSIVASGGGELEFLNNGTATTTTNIQGSLTTSISNLLNLNTTNIASGVGSEISAGSGFSVTSGSVTNRNTGTLTGGTGTLMTGGSSSITQSGGTFTNQNQGIISGGAVGSEVKTFGTATFSGGTFQNLNNGTVSGSTGSELFASTLTIDGGTLSNTNSSGTINGATSTGILLVTNSGQLSSGSFTMLNQSDVAFSSSQGCFLNDAGGFSISGGNFNQTNQGAVSVSGSVGCETSLGADFNVTGGSTTIFNAGAITAGIGSEFLDGSNNLNLSNGSVTVTNSGSVTNAGSEGSALFMNDITVNGGSLSNSNSGPVSANAIGSILSSNFSSNLDGGTVTNSNSGGVSGGATGSNFHVGGTMTIAGSSFTNSNSNSVSGAGSKGALTSVFTDVNSSGTFTNINTGAVSGGVGCELMCTGSLQIDSGAMTNDNTGTVTGGGTGCLIQCTNFVMTGGKVVNNGPVSSSGGIGNLIIANSGTEVEGGIYLNNDTVQSFGFVVTGSGLAAGTGVFQDIGGAQDLDFVNGQNNTTGGGFVEPDNLSPGNPGVMTINGMYTQNSSGTLIINVFSPTNFSELLVTSSLPSPQGTATINGGTLDLNIPVGALPVGTATFPIIVANHGVSGAFTKIVNTNPFVRASLAISGDSFALTTTTAATAPTTKLTNFPSIIFSNLGNLNRMTEQHIFQMNNVIAQNEMIPSTYPCATTFDPRQTLYAANLSVEDLIAQQAPSHKKGTKEKQQQLIQEIQTPPIPNPSTIYFGPIGTLGNYVTKHGQTGNRYWTGGGTFGFNYAFNQFGIGSSLSYEHTHTNIKHHEGHTDTDEIDLNVYGSYVPQSLPQFAMSAIVGAGYQWNSFPRITGFPDTPIVAKAFPNGWDFTSTLGIQYTFMNPPFVGLPYGLQIVPLADVQYCYSFVDAYREHRAGLFELKYKAQNSKSLKLDLGFLVNYTFFTPTTMIRPQVTLRWRREFLYKREKSSYAFVHFDMPYTTSFSKAPNLNTAEATLDILTMFYGRFGIDFFYNFEWNTWFHDHSAYVNGTLSF